MVAQCFVDHDVMMAEDNKIGVRMSCDLLFSPIFDLTADRAFIDRPVVRVVGAVACAPAISESDSPSGMDGRIEALTEAVAEKRANEAERGCEPAETVAVRYKEVAPVDLSRH